MHSEVESMSLVNALGCLQSGSFCKLAMQVQHDSVMKRLLQFTLAYATCHGVPRKLRHQKMGSPQIRRLSLLQHHA